MHRQCMHSPLSRIQRLTNSDGPVVAFAADVFLVLAGPGNCPGSAYNTPMQLQFICQRLPPGNLHYELLHRGRYQLCKLRFQFCKYYY